MEAGLTLTGFAEGGGPVPVTLGIRAVRPGVGGQAGRVAGQFM